MISIFISYRRDDDSHAAGRLSDNLTSRFGDNLIYRDIDSIPYGIDWKKHIRKGIIDAGVILVLIGEKWLKLEDSKGNRKLDNPQDPVRKEIEIALKNNKPIIPVLLNDAQMPQPEDLPAPIRKLSYLNAALLRDEDFSNDLVCLINALENLTGIKLEEKLEDLQKNDSAKFNFKSPLFIAILIITVLVTGTAVIWIKKKWNSTESIKAEIQYYEQQGKKTLEALEARGQELATAELEIQKKIEGEQNFEERKKLEDSKAIITQSKELTNKTRESVEKKVSQIIRAENDQEGVSVAMIHTEINETLISEMDLRARAILAAQIAGLKSIISDRRGMFVNEPESSYWDYQILSQPELLNELNELRYEHFKLNAKIKYAEMFISNVENGGFCNPRLDDEIARLERLSAIVEKEYKMRKSKINSLNPNYLKQLAELELKQLAYRLLNDF